jgi:TnpA family transposase
MPRQELLSATQRAQLLALPAEPTQVAACPLFTPAELALIARHRGRSNRLGFAVQLYLLRHHGRAWMPEEQVPLALLHFLGDQIGVAPEYLAVYAQRDQTRREHLAELLATYDWHTFGLAESRTLSAWLLPLARTTDQGLALVKALLAELRQRHFVAPALSVLDRVASAVRHRARCEAYRALTADLTPAQRDQLDHLLHPRLDSRQTHLAWSRQPAGAPSAANILRVLERLAFLRRLAIPATWAQRLHQNRLTQMAREGANIDAAHLRDLGDERRYATLVAVALDTMATLTDEALTMHERFLGNRFNRAERRHQETFHRHGQAINDKMRLYVRIGQALLTARDEAADPYAAIEAILPWDSFRASVEEAAKLAQPADFDFLALMTDSYSLVRRYAPTFLDAFVFRAAPACADLLAAVDLLRRLNASNTRTVPAGAPTGFVRRRWHSLVFAGDGLIDRRYYELCVLAELRNALRSGDLWVAGSRQFRDFEEYLLPAETFAQLRGDGLPLAVTADWDTYLRQRSEPLHTALLTVNGLAERGELPDASLSDGVLKITPLTNLVPPEAEALMRQAYALLPRIKITELLVEVDTWTDFTRHFSHLRHGTVVKERTPLLTVVLADAINLGLTRMVEACPGTSLSRLSVIADWYIRDETYSKALAELINYHHQLPFAAHWGDGTTSSSDGQYFRAGGRGEAAGQVNARYGDEPGVTFYTHLSNQYGPYYTQVISAIVRDAPYVLDGLLYHESDLRIEEHYTDTAGFTDHVFALCHLLGFRFAPRIRDLADKRLYPVQKSGTYPALEGLVGGVLNTKLIGSHWEEILRLATSIKIGTVTASLILRKLGAYPRQNGLAVALRELGRLERTQFMLQWLQDPALRRRVHVGLNKGEARNALARAVFFNRLGELRDRRYENQRHRASGLNLLVAAIVLWNTVYLERAVAALRSRGQAVADDLLAHLSPLGWEHINLTGDYVWNPKSSPQRGQFRSLQTTPRGTP